MNRVLFFKDQKVEDSIYESHDSSILVHIKEVLKKTEGDSIKLCIADDGLFEAKIITLGDSIKVEILKKEESIQSNINLIIGLSRPPTCQKILEHGTTFGVSSFHFMATSNGEKSFCDSKLFKDQRYKKYIDMGLSQSDSYYKYPEVNLSKKWNLNDIGSEQLFVLDPFCVETFEDYNIDFDKKMVLAIGPERGWNSFEFEDLLNRGFKKVRLGPSKLRVELATYSALSQLDLIKMKSQK